LAALYRLACEVASFSWAVFATGFNRWWTGLHNCLTFAFLLQPASAGLGPGASAMSSHVYHEIYLHFNWHTKGDQPLLTGDIETLAHAELTAKCRRFRGSYLHGVGGTDTHVHLALSIEPFVTISELVQELKGASSFEVNKRMNRKALEWQRGYGVVSFGKRNLDFVLDYVHRQREHHANGQILARLEACDSPDIGESSPAEAG
jgi:putative transposase